MYKNFLFFCLVILLTSCSSSYKEVKKIKIEKPNNFNEYLLKQYKKKAIFEAEEMHDWNSAKLYSEKALRSINGDLIFPENTNYWKIPKDKISKINKAYDNLMTIYYQAIKKDPYNLAIAISSLDCWAEQQEENWQTWDINKCKEDFLNSMHILYEKISLEEEKNKLIKEQFSRSDDMDKVSNNFATIVTKNKDEEIVQIIYFDFNKTNLSNINVEKIKIFLKKYQNKIKKFLVIGHADTKGTKNYNMVLSLKRAEIVKKLLLENGINGENIKIIGKGEELLAVNTPDETKHPANRRVELKKVN